MKKCITLASAACLFFTALQADYCYVDDCNGYEESRFCSSSCLAPAVALGTVAVVAIIAFSVQNSGSGHGHSH